MRSLRPGPSRFTRVEGPPDPGGFFHARRLELTVHAGSIYNPGRQCVRCHNNLLDYFNYEYGKFQSGFLTG